MSISHHLDEATIVSFAAGGLAPALAAVAREHILRCAHCREELRIAEQMGEGLMSALAPAALSRPAPPTSTAARAEIVARPSLVPDLARVRWRKIGPGLMNAKLRIPGGALHLLKAAPGATVPLHDHSGGEITLVLEGALIDGEDRLEVGDVTDHDTDVADHKPRADDAVGCICLIGSEGKARFRTFLARLMQPFHGM